MAGCPLARAPPSGRAHVGGPGSVGPPRLAHITPVPLTSTRGDAPRTPPAPSPRRTTHPPGPSPRRAATQRAAPRPLPLPRPLTSTRGDAACSPPAPHLDARRRSAQPPFPGPSLRRAARWLRALPHAPATSPRHRPLGSTRRAAAASPPPSFCRAGFPSPAGEVQPKPESRARKRKGSRGCREPHVRGNERTGTGERRATEAAR